MTQRVVVGVFVRGVPRTKGSLDLAPRRGGGTYVRESVHNSKLWRRLVASEVRRWRTGHGLAVPADGPVRVWIAFLLPGDLAATGSGDLDKLARNVLDALTDAGAYRDDVQVVSLQCEKVGSPGAPGVHVRVVEAPR